MAEELNNLICQMDSKGAVSLNVAKVAVYDATKKAGLQG